MKFVKIEQRMNVIRPVMHVAWQSLITVQTKVSSNYIFQGKCTKAVESSVTRES